MPTGSQESGTYRLSKPDSNGQVQTVGGVKSQLAGGESGAGRGWLWQGGTAYAAEPRRPGTGQRSRGGPG